MPIGISHPHQSLILRIPGDFFLKFEFKFHRANGGDSDQNSCSSLSDVSCTHGACQNNTAPGPEVIKLYSCSTQLSTKFELLIKTRMPTNEEVSCLKSLKCCIYHAYKC